MIQTASAAYICMGLSGTSRRICICKRIGISQVVLDSTRDVLVIQTSSAAYICLRLSGIICIRRVYVYRLVRRYMYWQIIRRARWHSMALDVLMQNATAP
jgi:hypothetical protein